MATVGRLKPYCERILEENRWKLDKPIDFEHDGVSIHLGAIADSMDEWEGRVAEALGLSKASVSSIKTKHPDNLTLQSREALSVWQEKNGLEATYRNLIDVFLKAEKTSYADAVCKVLGMASKQDVTDGITTANSSIDSTANHSATERQDVASKKSYDDEKKQLLKENMAKIKMSFARLKRRVLRKLKGEHIDMQEFIAFVTGLDVPTHCVHDAKEIFTVFQAISTNLLWSYSEYGLLKSIAEEFVREETEQLIDGYLTELASFYATTRLADYIDLCQDDDELEEEAGPDVPLAPNPAKYNREYYQKLTIKIGRRVTNETLQYVADLWIAVSKFFALPSLTALLDCVVAGSLIISWLIPHHFAMQIRVNSIEIEAQDFFRAHDIIEVMIDDDCLYHDETTDDGNKVALLRACEEGNLDKVFELLEKISDFDFSQYDVTPLIAASTLEVLQVLLLYPFDVNGRNKHGVTALMMFSQRGRTDAVELLINRNADVNARSQDGKTALMVASAMGIIDVARLLIQHGAYVNNRSEDGTTALMLASQEGKTDVVDLLLKHNADVDARTEDGGTSLILASLTGRTDIVVLLLKHNANVHARMDNEYGQTALVVASLEGKTDVVKVLLKYNADVNARMQNGETALMVACCDGKLDTVELLIKHKADVNARTVDGTTALMFASQTGRIDIVELLIKHNADVNARTVDGMTTLMIASQNAGRIDLVELLIKHNADVNARIEHSQLLENGFTALMGAIVQGRHDVVEMLIKGKTNLNAKTENGYTALAYATQRGEVESVRSLLEAGADPNIAENETLWTPLLFASINGHSEIVQLLVEYGAQVDYKDKNGITALDTARTYNHTEVIDLLMAFNMSMETLSELNEEASQAMHPPTHLSEETRKHVLSAGDYNKKLFDKQKTFFKKITDFLLPERERKRKSMDKHVVNVETPEKEVTLSPL